jgi:transcriptional regulator with XRE-family HTH domain
MAARKIKRLRDNVAPMVVSGAQIRAARGLIGLSQNELARAANLSVPGLANIEGGKSSPLAVTLDRIVRALEARGVEFTNGDGPGVRLKKARE